MPEPSDPESETAPGSSASEDWLPLVYDELRRLARGHMAQERGLQTLTATALVHEAWLQLGNGVHWEGRRHFFGAAGEAMRRILIGRAREKLAIKRGAGAARVPLEDLEIVAESPDEELLAVHEALEKLRTEDAPAAEIVTLRYFAGLTWPEMAEVLETGERELRRQWQFARDWLHAEISGNLS